ncbi:MAG: hypothetical protein SGARI_007063, partial [Bacillariaceae sp.]
MWKILIAVVIAIATVQTALASTGGKTPPRSIARAPPPPPITKTLTGSVETNPSTFNDTTPSYIIDTGIIDYNLVPWIELNEWCSRLSGNIHEERRTVFLLEYSITRTKVLEELERRFQNKTSEEEHAVDLHKLYTVEEMDVVRRKNVTAFLEIRKREAERVNGAKLSDGIISKEPRNEKEAKDDTPATQLNESETDVTAKTEISYSQDCDDEVLSDEEAMEQALTLALGYGLDWKEYRNPQGYTHFEELLFYQPRNWKMHAREY